MLRRVKLGENQRRNLSARAASVYVPNQRQKLACFNTVGISPARTGLDSQSARPTTPRRSTAIRNKSESGWRASYRESAGHEALQSRAIAAGAPAMTFSAKSAGNEMPARAQQRVRGERAAVGKREASTRRLLGRQAREG
eukprot:6208679-Pleurochrysis_carterae.AAC.5